MSAAISEGRADVQALKQKYPAVMRSGPWPVIALAISLALLVLPLALAWQLFGVSGAQLWQGFWRLGQFATLMFPPSPGRFFLLFLHALGETLAIAFLGTLGASVLAFPFATAATRTVNRFAVLRFAIRRCFDALRSVDALIWALIWINVVGLGPFAGVLAILSSDVGALGKLFADAIEGVDDRPTEGIRAAGGTGLMEFRFAVLPQVFPVIVSQMLYYFESNTRSATIIGIVGAGGIGLHLYEQIRTLEWPTVAFIVLMILVTVAVIDTISSRLRRAIMGTAPGA